MKNLLTIIYLTLAVSVSGQAIEGKVIDGPLNEIISFASIRLLNSSATTTKGQTITDKDGGFKFINVSTGVYCISVSYVGYKVTTFYNIKITGDTAINLDIHYYCPYDSLRNNKICPVCHRQDKVIPIIYGLLISTKGNPMKNEGKTFKAGGCNIGYCDPHWYCKRDKKEF